MQDFVIRFSRQQIFRLIPDESLGSSLIDERAGQLGTVRREIEIEKIGRLANPVELEKG